MRSDVLLRRGASSLIDSRNRVTPVKLIHVLGIETLPHYLH